MASIDARLCTPEVVIHKFGMGTSTTNTTHALISSYFKQLIAILSEGVERPNAFPLANQFNQTDAPLRRGLIQALSLVGDTLHTPSQAELDNILKRIDSGEFGDAAYKPERRHAEQGRDMISVPNEDATICRVYERKQGEEWKEVPFMGGKSEFE